MKIFVFIIVMLFFEHIVVAQWAPIYTVYSSSNVTLTCLDFANDSVGYVGVSEYYYSPDSISDYAIYIIKTENYGLTWDTIYYESFVFPTTVRYFTGVSCQGENEVWFCFTNSDHLLHTMDGGVTWEENDTGLQELVQSNAQSADFGEIEFANDLFGIAYSEGESTHSMMTQDGGQSWELFDEISGVDLDLDDECNFASAQSGLVSWSGGCSFTTSDFWLAFGEPPRIAYGVDLLNENSFVCVTTGVIGFNNFGSIVKTIDGGVSYEIIDLFETNSDIDIEFLDDMYGFASFEKVGFDGFLCVTFNAGESWYELTCQDDMTGHQPNLRDIVIIDENIAYAHTFYQVYRTLNGGGPLGDVHTSTRNISKPQKVSVYPNPARDEITISGLTGNLDQMTYSVFNINQQFVLSGKNPSAIQVNTLPPGIYTLRIEDNSNSMLLRFVKE
jgi:photosystem II stability/assembly factor-like uncharacterized protein